MYYGHSSWIPIVIFGAMFAMRYANSRRRGGRTRGPGSGMGMGMGQRSPFTGPSRPPTAGSYPVHSTTPPPASDVASPPATPVHGAGTGPVPSWLRDPFFKHDYRYWSGSEWTEHVTDDGVPSIDPPPDHPSRRTGA